MSQENVEFVRKPFHVRKRSSRTVDERIFLRFPRLYVAVARRITTLPLRSRVRQAAVWRAIRLGVEAFNRRDIDALFVGYHDDFELHPAREFVEAGLAEASYCGLAGYLEYLSDWSEVWGGSRRVEPEELIDMGDRFVLLGSTPERAQSSGVALTEAYANVCTLKDGKLIRQREFVDHAEALEAVGLSE